MKSTLLILFFVAFSSFSAYTVQDFFEDALPECITAEEHIGQLEKSFIIESGYALSPVLSSAFSVVSIRDNRLQLRDVDIHLYSQYNDRYIVSVTSILGNHCQNHQTKFYIIESSGEISAELSVADVGINDVMSNEFLEEKDFFSGETNLPVPFHILEDGSFEAEPWTWMNPEWSEREIVNRILYVWISDTFTKVVIDLTD